MIKKILKIVGIVIVLLIVLLFTLPFLFKDTIKGKIKDAINENVNATVNFSDASLSLFKNFPNATITVDSLLVLNKAPFEGDTLASARKMSVAVSLKDLFKSEDEPYHILGFTLDDASAYIHINKDGKGNYDIVKGDTSETQSNEESSSTSVEIQSYEVNNLKFAFRSDSANMLAVLDSIYHTGKGDFSGDILDLDTESKALVSFEKDSVNYMRNIPVSLDAVLGIDLASQKYTFKENKAFINKLPLVFDGYLQLLDEGQQYDMTFKTSTSSFENFLALIPEVYSKNVEGVQTTGNFTVDGVVKGKLTDETIPTLDIRMLSDNASFKYPSLPKSVRNIHIDAKVFNKTGILNDTYVDLSKLAFVIDEDSFTANALIKNIEKNPMVSADMKGTINLAKISQAYPVSLDKKLDGILKMDISTQFDMNSIEKSQYQNVKNEGTASLSNFSYEGEGFVNPFHIETASLKFNPSYIEVPNFQAKTGQTDLAFNGRVDNLYGFLFNKEVLKGKFNLNSDKFVVGDFMQSTTEETAKTTEKAEKEEPKEGQKSEEALKIPAFLDCTISAKANTVIYDNLELKNATGDMIIRNEAVQLSNLSFNLFGGTVALKGNVSTKEKTPTFEMGLDMSKLNVVQSFTQIEMLKKIAPIANAVQGNFNSIIKVSGLLNSDFTPEMNSLTGDMSAFLSDAKIDEKASPLISALDSKIKGLNLANIDLNSLKAYLSFADGKVNLKPFDIKVAGVDVKVAGSHGFDNSIDYNLIFDLPARMLGSDVNKLLAKLSPEQQKALEAIPVSAVVGGTFKEPKVSTDMTSVVSNLTQQLVKMEAEKLTKKGVDALGGILGINKKKESSQANDSIPNKSDAEKEPSKEKTEDKVEKAVKGVLEGILR